MTVEVVADGIHVPPTILRLVYKIKGVERTCLITDALACAASDSQVAFDPRVIIEDGVCKLADRSAWRVVSHDGPLDPYDGAKGRDSLGGCRAYGLGDSRPYHGRIRSQGNLAAGQRRRYRLVGP